jgi:hypothetical protein
MCAIVFGGICVKLSGEDGLEVVSFDPFEYDFETGEPAECTECRRRMPFCEWDEPSGRSVEKGSERV